MAAGLGSLHELCLTILLRDVVKQKRRVDTAKMLGVNCETLGQPQEKDPSVVALQTLKRLQKELFWARVRRWLWRLLYVNIWR